jgi:hypothetical protein
MNCRRCIVVTSSRHRGQCDLTPDARLRHHIRFHKRLLRILAGPSRSCGRSCDHHPSSAKTSSADSIISASAGSHSASLSAKSLETAILVGLKPASLRRFSRSLTTSALMMATRASGAARRLASRECSRAPAPAWSAPSAYSTLCVRAAGFQQISRCRLCRHSGL